MPNKEIHVRRWQAVAILLLLTGTYVLGIFSVRTSLERTSDVVARNTIAIHRIEDLRQARLRDVRRADVRACLNIALISRLAREGIRRGPKNAVPLLRALNFTENQIIRFLEKARRNATREESRWPKPDCSKLPTRVMEGEPPP